MTVTGISSRRSSMTHDAAARRRLPAGDHRYRAGRSRTRPMDSWSNAMEGSSAHASSASAFRHPHFRSRPSAAGMGTTRPIRRAANFGPTNKKLTDAVKANVEASRKENPNAPVPIDLVTTSASGFDPHVSPAAADFRFRAWRASVA